MRIFLERRSKYGNPNRYHQLDNRFNPAFVGPLGRKKEAKIGKGAKAPHIKT